MKWKKEIKHPKKVVGYAIQKQWKTIVLIVKKITINQNSSVIRTKQTR